MLSKLAQLNVDEDTLSKEEWNRNYENGMKQADPIKFEGPITVYIEGKPLTWIRNSEIYNKIIVNQGKEYWKKIRVESRNKSNVELEINKYSK